MVGTEAASRVQGCRGGIFKLGHYPAFDLEALAHATDGFSGSEIEGVVVAGLFSAFAAEGELVLSTLLDEAERTRPLSVIRSEDITALRTWARERTIPAN